jgi:hypothetical protein
MLLLPQGIRKIRTGRTTAQAILMNFFFSILHAFILAWPGAEAELGGGFHDTMYIARSYQLLRHNTRIFDTVRFSLRRLGNLAVGCASVDRAVVCPGDGKYPIGIRHP